MDHRWKTLSNSAKDLAVVVNDSATGAVYAVAKGAAAASSCVQSKLKLANLKAEVNLQMRELGEMLYATHTGNPTDSEVLLQKMEQIDALKAQISELGTSAAPSATLQSCPVCNAKVETPSDSFCKHCGAKL